MKIFWICTIALVTLISCEEKPESQDGSLPKPDALRQQISYLVAYDMAKNFARDSFPMDFEYFFQGMKDFYNGKDEMFTNDERVDIMEEFSALKMAQQRAAMEGFGEKAGMFKEMGPGFLENEEKKSGVQKLPSGVLYTVEREGTGPIATIDDMIRIHLKASLMDGTVFNDTYERGAPIEVPVQGSFPGLRQAILKMPAGSKWRVVVPSSQAFGDMGSPPLIPPFSVIVAEIEILDVLTQNGKSNVAPPEGVNPMIVPPPGVPAPPSQNRTPSGMLPGKR